MVERKKEAQKSKKRFYLLAPRLGALLFGSGYFLGGVGYGIWIGHWPKLLPFLLAFLGLEFFVNQSKYLLNDLKDRKRDARHPLRLLRPTARGSVSPNEVIAVALLRASVGLFLLGMLDWRLLLLGASLLAVQAIYDFLAKPVPVLNVLIVSLGCLIRFASGVLITTGGIPPPFVLLLPFLFRLVVCVNTHTLEGLHLARLGRLNVKPHLAFYVNHPNLRKWAVLPFAASCFSFLFRYADPTGPFIVATLASLAVLYYRVNGPSDTVRWGKWKRAANSLGRLAARKSFRPGGQGPPLPP